MGFSWVLVVKSPWNGSWDRHGFLIVMVCGAIVVLNCHGFSFWDSICENVIKIWLCRDFFVSFRNLRILKIQIFYKIDRIFWPPEMSKWTFFVIFHNFQLLCSSRKTLVKLRPGINVKMDAFIQSEASSWIRFAPRLKGYFFVSLKVVHPLGLIKIRSDNWNRKLVFAWFLQYR